MPGVTAATAVPTYAGIPLTHREHTASVAFVTGHEDPTKPESGVHWDRIATGIGTLVFFMGMKNLARASCTILLPTAAVPKPRWP